MIVPRTFSAHAASFKIDKFDQNNRNTRPRNASRSPSPSPFRNSASPPRTILKDPRSEPVKIPSRTTKNIQANPPRPAPVTVQPAEPVSIQVPKPRRESAQELLSATTIPIRRKPKGRPSQRLPRCDHVADFSRLLLDDVKPLSDGSLPRSVSNSQLDGLFGNIDGLVEGQMFVGSEGIDDSILTIRSASSDSLASLASPDDYGSSEIASNRSSVGKSYQERRARQIAASEDCASDHPLIISEDSEELTPVEITSPLLSKSTPQPSSQKQSRSFKSSLTASLKAIKSAAQSVSKTGLRSTNNTDEYLARSFFDIQPLLTDDKRPPPTSALPSPELRRYLNPYTATAPPDSPAQLHFWQDDRHVFTPKLPQKAKAKSKRKSSRYRAPSPPSVDELPPVVALATCLPPSVRTANASSPPIWLRPDGTPSNRHTANPLLLDPLASNETVNNMTRSREPRENSDFLRVFVCEMEMRRKGKLNDDMSAGRARLWLPPMNDGSKPRANALASASPSLSMEAKRRAFLERWRGESIDDF